jgi:phosphoribosylanthranilate isomerase
MTPQVKICGINDMAAFDAAVEAGADWLGFVFFPGSPRYVTPALAAELSVRSPGGPPRVGLFVDPTEELIATTLEAVQLDILQLYSVRSTTAFRDRFGLPVWPAVGVASVADLPTDAGGADRLLIEAKPPPGASRPGGNAVTLDWSLLRGWRAPTSWILGGGLTTANVAEAIDVSGAPAVDVSSGVESAPGTKDPALIRAFIASAKLAGIRLRRATPADAEALGEVHVAAWREAYAGLMPDRVLTRLDPGKRATMWRRTLEQGTRVNVAQRAGTIVGFASSGAQRDLSVPVRAEIHAIYVRRSAQRQGVGRALMSAVARDLLAQGYTSALLWVLEANTPARRFYEELGGREICRRQQERDGFSATGIAYAWEDLNSLV